MLATLLARHLRMPSGVLGHVVAHLMNAGNRPMNRAALDALAVAPTDRVLEVGFGGASLLPPLLRRSSQGRVVGLERSPTMLTRARRRHRSALESGRLTLTQGAVEALPFPDDAFDGILTVNTIYFWDDPARAAAELARTLAPSGRLVIAYGRVEDMKRLPPTRYGFRLWAPSEVEALLLDAGFSTATSTESVSLRRSYVLTAATTPAA